MIILIMSLFDSNTNHRLGLAFGIGLVLVLDLAFDFSALSLESFISAGLVLILFNLDLLQPKSSAH